MEVSSLCTLPVASLLWQPRPGAWMLTFVCKATYVLQPGESPLAQAQEPIYETDQHWSNDPAWSLYAPRDVVPIRPRADIVLVGHAFAPDEAPVRSLVARVLVADIDKAVEVWCDRWFTQDGGLHEGQPFARMPLLYERAAGGPDTQNPVGMWSDTRGMYGKRELPNLQPPGLTIKGPSDAIEPVGFGPIAPAWNARRGKLGRYAASWDEASFHLQPLPQDIDASYFNAAPWDQQTAALHGAERIILDNLHPEHHHLVTSLSGHTPQAFVERPGKPAQSASMRPDLLWIHTDRGVCTLTWRGQIPVEHPREQGRVRVALAEPGQVLTWEDIERSPPTNAAAAAGSDEPPKRRSSRQTVPDVVPDASATSTLGVAMKGLAQAATAAAVLPFAPASSPQSPPTRASSPEQRLSGTPFTASSQARAGVPDAWSSPASSPPPTAPSGVAQLAPAPAAVLKSLTTPPVSTPPIAPPPVSAPSIAAPPVSAPPIAPPPIAAKPIAPPPKASQPSASPLSAPVTPPPAVPLPVPSPSPQPKPVDSPWVSGVGKLEPSAGKSVLETSAAPAPAPYTRPSDAASGVLAVSNTAAVSSLGGLPVAPLPSSSKRADEGASTTSASFQVRPSPSLDAREVVHLIWYAPESVARICRVPVFRAILDEMEQERSDGLDDLEDGSPAKDPVEIEDRRDMFEILARAASQDVDQLGDELQGAVRSDRKFVPPLLLLSGEISLPFDEREVLKATIGVVSPVMGNDEGLKAAVKDGRDFLSTPDLICPPQVVESVTARIKDAFQKAARRGVAPDYLDAQVERALLERRSYQKRPVLGMNAIRGFLHSSVSGAVRPAPVYLPEEITKKLPLYSRFRARIIAELYLQEDQYEAHPGALKVLALGRVAAAPDGRDRR